MTKYALRFARPLLVLAACAAAASLLRASAQQIEQVACAPRHSLQTIVLETSKGKKRLAIEWSTITDIQRGIRRNGDLVIRKADYVAFVVKWNGSQPRADNPATLQIGLFPDSRIGLVKRVVLPPFHGQPLNFWDEYSETDIALWASKRGAGPIFDLQSFVARRKGLIYRIMPYCPVCKMLTPKLFYVRGDWRMLDRVILSCAVRCTLNAFVSRSVGLVVTMSRNRKSGIPRSIAHQAAVHVDRLLTRAVVCGR